MAQAPTADQVVEAAASLNKDVFTRADVADKLGVDRSDFKDAFKEARDSGRLEKVGNEDGTGQFKLAD